MLSSNSGYLWIVASSTFMTYLATVFNQGNMVYKLIYQIKHHLMPVCITNTVLRIVLGFALS